MSREGYGLMQVWVKSVPGVWLSFKSVKIFISSKVKGSYASKTLREPLKWFYSVLTQWKMFKMPPLQDTFIRPHWVLKVEWKVPKSFWKISAHLPESAMKNKDALMEALPSVRKASHQLKPSVILYPWPGASRASLNDAAGQVSLARGEAHLACRALAVPEGIHRERNFLGSAGLRWRKRKDGLHINVF